MSKITEQGATPTGVVSSFYELCAKAKEITENLENSIGRKFKLRILKDNRE